MVATPKTCRECGSDDLAWQTHNKNIGQAQEGRLRTHEVECLFVLGCNYCSETLLVLSADHIAGQLNASS